MRLLPELIERPHFEPLRRFLTDDGDLRKRYQLAERLADLFDQYQVYRADWLKDWAVGEHVLNSARGERKPLPVGNRWQAQLWRALLEDVGEAGMAQSRAGVHQRFIERINSLTKPLRLAQTGDRFRHFVLTCPSTRGAGGACSLQSGAAVRA